MNFILSIIKPEDLSLLLEIYDRLGLPLTVSFLGKGTAVQSMLDLLGI